MKITATPVPALAGGIRALRRDLGPRVRPGFVVHGGGTTLPLGPDAVALPFASL